MKNKKTTKDSDLNSVTIQKLTFKCVSDETKQANNDLFGFTLK